jgi:hypothetical protein
MIDWPHIIEVVVGNLFVAGVAYGAIKAEIRALHSRIAQCEADIRAESVRIDNLLFQSKGH